MKFINLVNPVNPVKKSRRGGFTIVELLVAMTLLVVLLALSGVVFNTTVEAHRTAGATIDVTRNLRAITDQLNADFRGLRKDAPVFIAFNSFDTDGDTMPDVHYDTIHFFADGDFQTMRRYPYDDDTTSDGIPDGNKTIYANLSRIYYGHANTPAGIDYRDSGLLSRKSILLTLDGQITRVFNEIPPITNSATGFIDYTPFDDLSVGFGIAMGTTYPVENEYEFNTITLTDWSNALNHLDTGIPLNADHFIYYCMLNGSRPRLDLDDVYTLHLLLSQGVLQMQIQWAYTNDDLVVPATGLPPVPGFMGIRWWPDVDPLGDGSDSGFEGDSDFLTMGKTAFGVYFNLPGGTTVPDWFAIVNCGTLGTTLFRDTFYPRALKFTFVLRDSNGLFDDGRTFTHIVYLDN